MKPRKPKSAEPSLRDKLSANLLADLVADYAANGAAVLEALRLKAPEKYIETAARLIAAVEPRPDGFEGVQSMQELGMKLLQSIGFSEPDDFSIQAAIDANNTLIAELERIRDRAQN